MTTPKTPSLLWRLWWTALLVLIALGGAGLAVAADQQQNSLQRPELTWRADRAAQPWIQELADALGPVDRAIVDLSGHGRQALGHLQPLDREQVRAAFTAGDEISTGLVVAIEQVSTLRVRALNAVDLSRLGPSTRDALEKLGSATNSAQQVPALWRAVTTAATPNADLGPSLTEALLAIEAAHTDILDALAAATGLDSGAPPEPTPGP